MYKKLLQSKHRSCVKDLSLRRIFIFGNSGAGKSTLARRLCSDENLAHLDLDSLAFKKETPTQRRDIQESLKEVDVFIQQNDNWVIEGGYSDIFEKILNHANEMIYLDLEASTCQENARKREWEPHKYESKEAQDKNLDMLLRWILDYYSREDSFSKSSHDRLFKQFTGRKMHCTHSSSDL